MKQNNSIPYIVFGGSRSLGDTKKARPLKSDELDLLFYHLSL